MQGTQQNKMFRTPTVAIIASEVTMKKNIEKLAETNAESCGRFSKLSFMNILKKMIYVITNPVTQNETIYDETVQTVPVIVFFRSAVNMIK